MNDLRMVYTARMAHADIKLAPEWKVLLAAEFTAPYFTELAELVRAEYLTHTVFPPPKYIFRALDLVAPSDVAVVILGQDPYHTPGVADGLAFSTGSKNRIPPSLANIFKEIESEFAVPCIQNPDLTRWANQGVLLLNASLSVRSGEANSHALYGWHTFTDAIIKSLSENYSHIVFMLWGTFAGKKEVLIDSHTHLVLKSAHPSPLSAHRGFFRNAHFTRANAYLIKNGKKPIDWR